MNARSLRSVLAVGSALALFGCGSAEDAADGDVESLADDTVEQDERAGALGGLLDELDPDGPGCVLAAEDPDGRYVVARGLADLDTGVPLDADTIFDIGSVSKQMTAGVVALLVLDGEVSLDDDAAELAGLDPFAEPVTVDDLVHHTSGLVDYVGLLDAEDTDPTTMDDALDVISRDEAGPSFEPGTDFEYSNTNYVLLSQIVDEVSGTPLAAVTDARVFAPLGMGSAVVRDDQGTLLPGQAQGYAPSDDELDWDAVGSSWRQTGDGAVHLAVPELLTWAALFHAGAAEDTAVDLGADGVATVDDAAWVDLMLTPGAVADDDGTDYAFGLSIGERDGERVLSHGGSWIGYSSALAVLPDASVSAAASCNIDGFDAEGLVDQALDRLTPSS